MRRRGQAGATPAAHVGYYLLDDGPRGAREGLGYRPSPKRKLTRAARGHPAVVYLGPIALLTLLILAPAAVYTAAQVLGDSRASGRCAGFPAALAPRWPWSIGSSLWLCHPGLCPSSSFREQGAHRIPDSCARCGVPAM